MTEVVGRGAIWQVDFRVARVTRLNPQFEPIQIRRFDRGERPPDWPLGEPIAFHQFDLDPKTDAAAALLGAILCGGHVSLINAQLARKKKDRDNDP